MTPATCIDIAEAIENQGSKRFLVVLVILSCTITFLDGLDANLVGFAAPYFSSEYGLSRLETANIFSAQQLGTLIGGFLWVFAGDIAGRRPAIILSTLSFGAATAAFYFAHNYESLLVLRFLDGLPLGGMLPLAWALNIEYAPRRFRSTIVTIIMVGYSTGISVGGPLCNWLAPRWGWKAGFLIGGCAAIAVAMLLWAKLPESVRFLVVKKKDPMRVAHILRKINPHWELDRSSTFQVSDEPGHARDFAPALLFSGRLARITPLVWLAYILSSFTVNLLLNWTPLVLESLRYSRKDAALAATLASIMGALGGLALMGFTDRKGVASIAVLPGAGCLLLSIAGGAKLNHTELFVLIGLIGFCINGGHFGMHSICGVYYPSSFRANGAGWATSIAKIGSIAGPIAGGLALSAGASAANLFAVLAIAPALLAATILMLGRTVSGGIARADSLYPGNPDRARP